MKILLDRSPKRHWSCHLNTPACPIIASRTTAPCQQNQPRRGADCLEGRGKRGWSKPRWLSPGHALFSAFSYLSMQQQLFQNQLLILTSPNSPMEKEGHHVHTNSHSHSAATKVIGQSPPEYALPRRLIGQCIPKFFRRLTVIGHTHRHEEDVELQFGVLPQGMAAQEQLHHEIILCRSSKSEKTNAVSSAGGWHYNQAQHLPRSPAIGGVGGVM